jgi:hypothetical protein
MNGNLDELISAYNDAVGDYDLARLEYAMLFPALDIPPVGASMKADGFDCSLAIRSASATVQAVRDFFESIYDGTTEADPASLAFELLHDASLEMTRRFFHVSLTRMGISMRELPD